MPTTLEKEWAAVDGDEIVLRAETKESLREKMRTGGYSDEDLEIIALPIEHNSMFV